MSPISPDALGRLRAANPVPLEADRGDSASAKQTLERILKDQGTSTRRPSRRIRPRLPRGGLGIAVAVAMVGAGAAVAATNPFGWWSANPDTARYSVNPAARARTPTASSIRCHSSSTSAVRCSSAGAGQLYTRIDTIRLPGATNQFTRANLLKQIARAEASHKLSSSQAVRFRHDLAQVHDSFFVKLRAALRYGTYGGGADDGRVPPPGVPEFLACGQDGSTISCQNLNGDEAAPIGAGVYMAEPAPDWKPAPPRRRDPFLPAGLSFSPAEYRVLVDMFSDATTTTSSSARPTPRSGG